MIYTLYFTLFSVIAVGCAIALLVTRHPLKGALSLIGVMLSLAGIYSLLAAPFLGVVQILTYAGAIMMLVVFVIMVLNSAHDHVIPRFDRRGLVLLGFPLLMGAGLIAILRTNVITEHPMAVRGTTQNISAFLFNTTAEGSGTWLLFLFVGLLLLSAMAAAVLLAKKRLDNPKEAK